MGETLHHDIRIKRFARLGGTILFYFEYDCTSNTDGRPVLQMRNGCAGFFTPGELATPHGVDARPEPLATPPAPVRPRLTTTVRSLDEDGVQALVDGLQVALPKIVNIQIGMGQRLVAQGKALVEAGQALPSIAANAGLQAVGCIAGAAEMAVSASASVSVNVEASASVSGSVGG